MVCFHLCYDLSVLKGVELPLFASPLIDVWRASISWSFLFLAGIMCNMSRSNPRRALRYLFVSVLIWASTIVARVDDPISFGIVFCMGASTLLAAALERIGSHFSCHPAIEAVMLFLAFLVLLPLPKGFIGLGGLKLMLPRGLYETDLFSWLGLPGPRFSSGDYYPLLPYSLLYLSGARWGGWALSKGMARAVRNIRCRPLELVGRHALFLYLLHQPILLLILGLL